ncbi:amidase domain-containing protein [Clostridium tertium]|jgi:hypothetical protein
MKKIISKVLSCILFISLASFTSVQASEINYANTTEEEISDTIIGYLKHNLNLQKDLVLSKNNYILPGSKLEQFSELSSKSIVEWYSSSFGQLDWFNLDINIKSIERTNESIQINVDEIVECQYVGSNVETSYTNNHIIELKYNDNKLLVEKDILQNDSLLYSPAEKLSEEEYNIYIDKITSIEKEKSLHLEDEIEAIGKANNKSLSIQTRAGRYNRTSAANAAILMANQPEDYPDNDCTNFVSKALAVGGLPKDGTWYQGSLAWIQVITLRNYLISSGKAVEYYSIESSQLADVVQFYNRDYQNWTHSVIITGVLGSNRLVSAHSYPAKNVAFTTYFPGKPFYSSYRVLHITY